MKIPKNLEKRVSIWTSYGPRVGYVIPSIHSGFMINKALKDAGDKFFGDDSWNKDVFLNEGGIPKNFDVAVGRFVSNPVTRLSKNLFRKNANVITRYDNDREYIYVIGQLEGSDGTSTAGFISYDFVESGFFGEEPWLDEDFHADLIKFTESMRNLKNIRFEDDELFDNLRNWVASTYAERENCANGRENYAILPGIAMDDESGEDTVRSFFFTNHPGEKGKGYITFANDAIEGDISVEEKIQRYFESIWKYKYCFQDNKELKFSNWLNSVGNSNPNHCHIFHDDLNYRPDFLLLSPRSEGYISYVKGKITLNLYKEIFPCEGQAIPYTTDELVSKVRLIVFDELNWVEDVIKRFTGKEGDSATKVFIESRKGYREELKEILILLDFIEGKSIFEYIEDVKIVNLLSENNWVFDFIVRDLNYFPIPEGVKVKAYAATGKEVPTKEYSFNSIYSIFFEKLKLNWGVSPTTLEFVPEAGSEKSQFNDLKTNTGHLYESLKICPFMYKGVDLSLIENLPNVTLENFQKGRFVYREQYYLGDGRWYGRDIWYEEKDTTDILFSLFGKNEALGEDDDDDVCWNSTSLNGLYDLLNKGIIKEENVPEDTLLKLSVSARK